MLINLLTRRTLAIVALIGSTAIFAINIFSMFSVFFLVAQEFRVDVSFLGNIAASMTLGIGLFQIPGGIIAAKYHPKMAATLGMIIIATSSMLVAVSTDINQITIFRFILGAGLALYFPSAIVLVTEYFRKGSEAFGVGTITGANSAGGVIGLVMWAIMAGIIGWRGSIVIAAILAVAAAIALFFSLPNPRGKITSPTISTGTSSDHKENVNTLANRFVISKRDIFAVLKDKSIILMGLLLLGGQVVLEQTLGFMPFYLQSSLRIDPALAGLVSSFTLMAALIGAPLAGLVYDKRKTRFLSIILVLASLLLAGAAINYFQSLGLAVVSTIFVGFAGGGLFALFSNAARAKIAVDGNNKHPAAFTTLSVNWVHMIALTGTFWAPLLFGFATSTRGYTTSWPLIGIVSFILILIFSLVGKRAGIFKLEALKSFTR